MPLHHTRMNIPFNLAKRNCAIHSNANTRDTRLHEIRDVLITTKYPPSLNDIFFLSVLQLNIHEIKEGYTTKCPTIYLHTQLS